MLPAQKGGSACGDGVYTAAGAEEREPRAVLRLGCAPTSHFIRTLHGPEGSPLDHHCQEAKATQHAPNFFTHCQVSVSGKT